MNNIYLPIDGVHRKFTIDDILYALSEDNHVIFYFKSRVEKIKLRITMKALIEALDEHTFSRCHRQYIVNVACIESFEYSKMEITLSDGSKLPVSRSRKNDLLDMLCIIG